MLETINIQGNSGVMSPSLILIKLAARYLPLSSKSCASHRCVAVPLNEKGRNNDKTAKNRATVCVANVERGAGDEQVETEKATRFNGQVSIRVHSIRKRLTDADGICSKYAIDAVVDAGILPDDSPKYVTEVSHTQEKGKEEKTFIIITEGE